MLKVLGNLGEDLQKYAICATNLQLCIMFIMSIS